jgi:hypothetical protein
MTDPHLSMASQLDSPATTARARTSRGRQHLPAALTRERRRARNAEEVPAPDELRDAIAPGGGAEIAICELQYYWYATYQVAGIA